MGAKAVALNEREVQANPSTANLRQDLEVAYFDLGKVLGRQVRTAKHSITSKEPSRSQRRSRKRIRKISAVGPIDRRPR